MSYDKFQEPKDIGTALALGILGVAVVSIVAWRILEHF